VSEILRASHNKSLHTNRRHALGFGLSAGLFNTWLRHHVIVRAAVGELSRYLRHEVALGIAWLEQS